MSIVSTYNEWDPIEEIIVGSVKYAQIPEEDLGFKVIQTSAPQEIFKNRDICTGAFPEQIIDETEEDIQKFIDELKKLNIIVRQPTPLPLQHFSTFDWSVDSYFCYCPRDIMLTFDDMIIETPNVFRSRYFETCSYKEILIDYLKSNSRWISAPKPRLLDNIYNSDDPMQLALKNLEPVFDAANIIRAGRDLFYLVSDTGNELGLQWLQTIVGNKARVHPCHNLYSSIHIDSTIALLRPGLALINPSRVNDDNLPPLLKKWDIIKAPEMVEFQYSDLEPMSSAWIGMNLLMLRPDLAVVDAHQAPLIAMLEKKGINTIPLKLRHGRTLGGGFHCITLDVRRKGSLEDYF